MKKYSRKSSTDKLKSNSPPSPAGPTTPITSTVVDLHPLTPDVDANNGYHNDPEESLPSLRTLVEDNESFRQICATFSSAMAHAAYIPFCILIGQIQLNKNLYNTELIENIAYSHDEVAKPNSLLPSVWETDQILVPDSESESGSEESNDDEANDDLKYDVALKFGPVVALHGKSGLGEDSCSFGRSNWFVDLDEGEGEVMGVGSGGGTVGGGGGGGGAVKGEDGAQTARGGEGTKPAGGVGLAFLQQRQRSGSQTESGQEGTKSDSMDRPSANFFAKFGKLESKGSPASKRAFHPRCSSYQPQQLLLSQVSVAGCPCVGEHW